MTKKNEFALVAAAAVLALGGCGGAGAGSAEPKAPAGAAAREPTAASTSAVSAGEGEADATARSSTPVPIGLDWSEDQVRALCQPKPTEAGPSLAKVEEDMRSTDSDVTVGLQKLLQAPADKCSKAAQELDEKFQNALGPSSSWCDQKLALGMGISGPELMSASSELFAAMDARLARMKGGGKPCLDEAPEQALAMLLWRVNRNTRCAPSAQQKALLECGVLSSTPETKKHAAAFCRALASRSQPAAQDRASVEACLSANVVVSSDARAAGSRGPEGDDGSRAAATPSLETRLLAGTAEFFEARAKEEAKLFAYEVVANHLCGDQRIKDLLTNTCALLKPEDAPNDEDKETLAATPAAIREAVRADFERLPEVLVTKLYRVRADPQHALACTTAIGWTFGKEAVEGADVLDLLANPDVILSAPLVKDKLEGTAEAACNPQTLAALATLAAKLKERLARDRPGLVRAVAGGDFARALGGSAGERAARGALDEYEAVLATVLMRVRMLDEANRAWKKEPSRANRAAVVNAGLRTIEPIITFAVKKQASPEVATKVAKNAELSIKLTGQLINREYSAAVVSAAGLGAADLSSGKVRNLLGLAAGLAQAESSDEVRATLEDAALPLGSWRRKNEKRFGMTLTGLVGAQASYEVVLEKTKSGGKVGSGPSVGPALLIGPDVHGGLGKGVRIGAQLSILDLGALLSFRTDEPSVENADGSDSTDTAEAAPELHVEQLFAPGLNVYLGIGPLTFGPTMSFVPALRSAGAPANHDALNVLRLGGFVAIDVSVLPLY